MLFCRNYTQAVENGIAWGPNGDPISKEGRFVTKTAPLVFGAELKFSFRTELEQALQKQIGEIGASRVLEFLLLSK